MIAVVDSILSDDWLFGIVDSVYSITNGTVPINVTSENLVLVNKILFARHSIVECDELFRLYLKTCIAEVFRFNLRISNQNWPRHPEMFSTV